MHLNSKMKPVAALVVAVLCGVAALASGGGSTALPQAPGAKADETEPKLELLQQVPYDRMTLIDNSTWEIEPISPRPLPAYDPSQQKKSTKKAEGDGETQDQSDEVVIHLMQGDQRDFKVRRASIKSIEYFEDMLIAEANRLILARNYPKAFEYLLAVQARNPNWKGLQDNVDKLLFEEGSYALAGNERDRGLRLLRELHARRADYEGLRGLLITASGTRVGEALDKGQYAYGRQLLHELSKIDADHQIVRDLKERYRLRAEDTAKRAEGASAGDRLDLLTEALRIWPTVADVAPKYEAEFRAAPTLDVGVLDLPRPIAPWVRSPASARVAPLLYLPILVDDSEEAQVGQRSGQLAAELRLADLGRTMDLTLRKGVPWSDGSRVLSSLDVVRALADRAQPRSPSYNARWADLLARIETLDSERITIRLSRIPLDPAGWLMTNVGPAHAAWDGRVSTPAGRFPVGDGPYVYVSQNERSALYQAADRSAAAEAVKAIVPVPKITRIREVRLASAGDAMGALERGDVTLLEHVPADRVAGISAIPDVTLGRYRLAGVHMLALDGRNPALKSRELRRAMSYAIDRKSILEETVLKRPIDDYSRPADGPFAIDSSANASDVAPLEYDPLKARMLVNGVRREMSSPKFQFTLAYPAIPEAQLAAPRIAEMLRNVGIGIDLVERSPTELEESLRSGDRFDIAYRVGYTDAPVREAGNLICPGYDASTASDGLGALASPRILQLLLRLEHAPDWNMARELVTQIDRESRDELPIIPLWQMPDHFAYRARLSGANAVADQLYQGIERWEIEPWYAKDPWD